MLEGVFQLLAIIWTESALFAAVGITILGVDDLAVDALWLAHQIFKRKQTEPEANAPSKSTFSQPLAIFVAAWQESDVIGPMLRHASDIWAGQNFRIFVGHYPNDPETRQAILAASNCDVEIVETSAPGPTTKADCLNHLWRAMLRWEATTATQFRAVVLHDAEDLVHAEELHIYRKLLDRTALVQIPVLPSLDRHSPWVSGHYLDEFAEAHSRDLVVRNAIGAALPLAGVGCAIRRTELAEIAEQRGGKPFDENSLTEDYELGLIIGTAGHATCFVREKEKVSGLPIAVHAHFPAELGAAIRQKTRWSVGIALHGWRKLGWAGGIAERWMRLRDRRSILAAFILTSAYFSGLLFAVLWLAHFSLGITAIQPSAELLVLSQFCLLLLYWRAAVRCLCVTRHYGIKQGLLSIPRMAVSSFIAIAAARSAVLAYAEHLKTGRLIWHKTQHQFPQVEVR